METNIQSLIKEYEIKVLEQDNLIEVATKSIRDIRKKNLPTNDYIIETTPFVTDRKIAETKRQCYIQFIVDIKSI